MLGVSLIDKIGNEDTHKKTQLIDIARTILQPEGSGPVIFVVEPMADRQTSPRVEIASRKSSRRPCSPLGRRLTQDCRWALDKNSVKPGLMAQTWECRPAVDWSRLMIVKWISYIAAFFHLHLRSWFWRQRFLEKTFVWEEDIVFNFTLSLNKSVCLNRFYWGLGNPTKIYGLKLTLSVH